jgi:hypothetical protein
VRDLWRPLVTIASVMTATSVAPRDGPLRDELEDRIPARGAVTWGDLREGVAWDVLAFLYWCS